MKFTQMLAAVLTCMTAVAMPPGYKGKPFRDEFHKSGPQVIPGKVQLALFDLGGEGVAYHDTDAVNQGSKLNHTEFRRGGPNGVLTKHCLPGTPEYICFFRENEAVDISYTKDFADFSHPNLFDPPKNQLYVGWEEESEWTNYTVRVKTAGTYRITALYGNADNVISFDIDQKPAAKCKLPVATGGPRNWNMAPIGEITFDKSGLHLLTVHYGKGNNLAYLEFELGAAENGAVDHAATADMAVHRAASTAIRLAHECAIGYRPHCFPPAQSWRPLRVLFPDPADYGQAIANKRWCL